MTPHRDNNRGTFVIDRDGVVRYVHRATNPQKSLDKKALLRHLATGSIA